VLNALPLLFLGAGKPVGGGFWDARDEFGVGRHMLYANRVPPATLLAWSRAVTILLTSLLGIILSAWTERRFGAAAALLAVCFYSFDPTVLAHGHYVTTDLVATLTITVACMLWGGYLVRPGRGRLLLAGIAVGAALLAKFSAIVLLLLFPLLAAIRVWQKRGDWPLRSAAAALGAAFAVASFVVWAGYRFELRTAAADPFVASRLEAAAHRQTEGIRLLPFEMKALDPATGTGRLLQWSARHIPLPACSYWWGLYRFAGNMPRPETYLLGRFSPTGFWYYFPVAFAVKTPLGTLLALAGVLMLWAMDAGRRGRLLARLRAARFEWFVLVLPPLAYFAAATSSPLNLGVRHILPVYPFLSIFLGATLVRAGRAGLLSAAALCLLLAFESLASYPHYLAFFQSAAGGPAAGPRYLLGSNIDWGQDLPGLQRYLAGRGVSRIRLAYWGQADPAAHRIAWDPLPPLRSPEDLKGLEGVVAVSVNNLYRSDGLYAALRVVSPVARIGWSIYVYDFGP
jgi:4-amino-4-deoxy-L-arabinose transferase-like glycosyltransferase